VCSLWTRQGHMTTEHRCKDCRAEREAWNKWFADPGATMGDEPPRPKNPRPAEHPGPRCTTHWRQEVKRRKAANHEKRVQNTYGLEKGEYAKLYAFQGGLCALCRRATGASRRLSVDHDHATGDVRGLLCRPCNSLLGHARDRLEFFGRCIAYLKIPPLARMREGWQWDE
jgi:hypothetical protein